MEYLHETEEIEFAPLFGYGYRPDAKPKKKKKAGEPEETPRFTGMKKPLSRAIVPLMVSLLFAAVIIACVLLSAAYPSAGLSASAPARTFLAASGPAGDKTDHV